MPYQHIVRVIDGALQLRFTQQYATEPRHGVVATVEQRTTGSGRSVLLSPEQVRDVRDSLTKWLNTTGAAKPLYEDGGRQAGIDYMDEPIKCEHCGITTTRRDAFLHLQHPCPGLLASQQAGEALIGMIQDQTSDPEPF